MKPISLKSSRFIKLAILFLFIATVTTTKGQAVGANRGDNAGAGGRRTIKGKIYLPGENARVTPFKIRLENPDMGSLTTFTDPNAEFTFNGIVAGSYNLYVDGTVEYEAAHESVYVEGATSGPIILVPIYLRRKLSADPAFAGVPRAALDSYVKGMEAGRKGESKKAIEHMKTSIASYQSFVPAYTELGAQYLKLGELDKAAKALEAALKLSPYDFDANLNSGITLLQQKSFAEAERALRVAREKREKAATPHYYLGLALLNLKRMDEAQQELETTISLPGGSSLAQAHRYLGGIYWGKRDYKRAADQLEAYLKLDPKVADAERTRAAIKDLRSKQ
jgi:Tfp pilus assembly protein PilF